jgi:cytochrome c oxidase cbb3-type subunit 3
MGVKVEPKFVAIAVVVVVALGAFGAYAAHRTNLSRRLLLTPADSDTASPQLVKYARQVGDKVIADQCARCHGPELKGNPAIGAPDLTDKVWLYDSGNVSDIERTVIYGIRSGHSKARNITDMPAVGRLGVLKPAEIYDVVQYVRQLSRQPHDAKAAVRGYALFKDKGNCFDCHAPDGTGNPDYGSTDFTANTWAWGGDYVTLFKTVRDGRHGLMPAFIDTLSAAQIRAVAVDVYERSHAAKPQQVAAN